MLLTKFRLPTFDTLSDSFLSFVQDSKHLRTTLPLENSAFHSFLASSLAITKNMKINRPWKELNIVKSATPTSLNIGVENVSIANTQVSPNRNITPQSLNMRRTAVLLSTDFCNRLAVLLVNRIRTTVAQTKTTALKIKIARIGTRKAPQKAPG